MKLFCDVCEAKLEAGCRPSEIKGCKQCPPPPQSSEYKRRHKSATYMCICGEPFLDIPSKTLHQTKCREALVVANRPNEAATHVEEGASVR